VKNIPYILFVLLFVTGGCADQNSGNDEDISTDLVENPLTAAGEGDDSKEVIMSFEDSKYDFGEIIQGEKISHSFTFTNTGDAPLIISSVRATCGCTVPTWSKEPIEPGDSEEIKVVFDSEGKSGTQTKDITIISNAVPNTSVLRITGEVIVP